MINFIAQLAPAYLYPFLYVGLIFLGGLVLMPAMYLTQLGVVNTGYLLLTSIVASLSADSFWYFVGRSTKKKKLLSLKFIQSKLKDAETFSVFFSKHGVLLVFLTKFIYGTRIASHVLAGLHKIHYFKFLGATALGTAIWFGIFYVLIRSIHVGIGQAETTALRIQLIFLLLIVILGILNWFTGTYIKKWLMKKKTK